MEALKISRLFRFWSEDYQCALTVKYECELRPGLIKRDTIKILSVLTDDGACILSDMSTAAIHEVRDILVDFIYR